MYADGLKQRAAADLSSDSMEELRENFFELPFAAEESDAKNEQSVSSPVKAHKSRPLRVSTCTIKGWSKQLSLKRLSQY